MTLRGLAETLFDAIEKEGARAPRLSSEERGTVCRVLRGVVEVEGFTQAASDEVIAFEGTRRGCGPATTRVGRGAWPWSRRERHCSVE
jgi:F0F1-type ATP synthase alpha subunit